MYQIPAKSDVEDSKITLFIQASWKDTATQRRNVLQQDTSLVQKLNYYSALGTPQVSTEGEASLILCTSPRQKLSQSYGHRSACYYFTNIGTSPQNKGC